MEIKNVRVYGVEESILASGYPMKADCEINFDDWDDWDDWEFEHETLDEKDLKRAKSLGNAKTGSGHDCFLKGIIVQFDLKAPEYFWRQFDRYHFRDYVSSQSKMHMILKMDIKEMCNKYVKPKAIENLRECITDYNADPSKENFQIVVSNVPAGLELTARITTNYLQLKSIRDQRKNHKLEEWREIFVPWINTLPMFKEIVLGK